MAITEHRRREEPKGLANKAASHDLAVEAYLTEALGTTLDKLAVGVIIVTEDARILHANAAARHMLEARSPVVSLGGCLGALDAELTKELRRAITLVRTDAAHIGGSGIGVPLTDKDMTAAAAHVLPLARRDVAGRRGNHERCSGLRGACEHDAACRYRHRCTHLRAYSRRDACPPAFDGWRKPRGGRHRARRQRNDRQDASQPHLPEDRRVAAHRPFRLDCAPRTAHSPGKLSGRPHRHVSLF